MSVTPYMGLTLPVPSSSTPDWGGLLNTAFSLLDGHDHTAGHGVQVPSAGININADLTFNGFNLTQARTLRLQQQAAAPALAADAGAVYVTTAGDLWYNNGAGQHIQITSGSALSAASLGGISGLGGTTAGAAYSNATKTFTFTQAANQGALLDAGPLVIRDTAASAFGITLQSPVGIAGAYALTLPTALPASNSLLSMSSGGVLSAFGTVSGSDLTFPGNLTLAGANPAILKATGANAQLQFQGNRSASDASDDVVVISTVTRTAGYLLGLWSNASVPVKKLQVDYQGLLSLASQAGPLQPSSLWTAITPTAGWTAGGGLGYWKDATGMVHLKGWLTRSGGASVAFTLPAGFRPAFLRTFAEVGVTAGVPSAVTIDTNGDVTLDTSTGTGIRIVDSVSFLAEA